MKIDKTAGKAAIQAAEDFERAFKNVEATVRHSDDGISGGGQTPDRMTLEPGVTYCFVINDRCRAFLRVETPAKS